MFIIVLFYHQCLSVFRNHRLQGLLHQCLSVFRNQKLRGLFYHQCLSVFCCLSVLSSVFISVPKSICLSVVPGFRPWSAEYPRCNGVPAVNGWAIIHRKSEIVNLKSYIVNRTSEIVHQKLRGLLHQCLSLFCSIISVYQCSIISVYQCSEIDLSIGSPGVYAGVTKSPPTPQRRTR